VVINCQKKEPRLSSVTSLFSSRPRRLDKSEGQMAKRTLQIKPFSNHVSDGLYLQNRNTAHGTECACLIKKRNKKIVSLEKMLYLHTNRRVKVG
jgi:hypothetical protein